MENQSHQLLAQFSQHKTTRWKLKIGIHLHMKMGNLSLIRAYLWKRFPRSFSFGQFMSSRLYLLCVQSTACSLRSGNDHDFLEDNRQETFWDLMFTLLMFDDKCNYVLKSSAKNRENDYPKCYFFFTILEKVSPKPLCIHTEIQSCTCYGRCWLIFASIRLRLWVLIYS